MSNIPEPTRDEFTELMHSEFTVSPETEIKHRVHSAVRVYGHNLFTLEEILVDYNLTLEQYNKYKDQQ
jgi:hypothetical protein